MPKRTNLFQEVVATVHRHLAGDAEVEESAMLLHRQTETLREVDVVIRSTVAGQEVVVSVEATSGGRRASVERVERMLKKHAELPTNKLVLVAQGGFASTARLLAEKNGAVPIAPEDMTGGEPAYGIVNNLNHVRARIFSLRVVELQLVVSDRQGGGTFALLNPPKNLDIWKADGEFLCPLEDLIEIAMARSFEELANDPNSGLHDPAWETKTLAIEAERFTPLINGEPAVIYLKYVNENGSAFHEVQSMKAVWEVKAEEHEIDLRHRRIGEVSVSYGAFGSTDSGGTFIATAHEGQERLTVRIDDQRQSMAPLGDSGE